MHRLLSRNGKQSDLVEPTLSTNSGTEQVSAARGQLAATRSPLSAKFCREHLQQNAQCARVLLTQLRRARRQRKYFLRVADAAQTIKAERHEPVAGIS
jgi:hypothetical protein